MLYKYNYSVYLRQNCIIPLLLLIFSSTFLALTIQSLWKEQDTRQPEELKSIILCGCIAVFLIVVNVVPLARGGIHLLYEKESDQIKETGVIEEKIEIPSFGGAKYETENNNCFGEAIVFNGKKYYLTTYYDLQLGDYVDVSVLPRSRFVLNIKKLQHTTGDVCQQGRFLLTTNYPSATMETNHCSR